jgi:iron only hydrogenase large subunit-like protein
MCRRCITVCSEIQATRALWAQNRGFESVAAPAFGHELASVACVQCGQCAAVCPTAAITEKDHIERVWAALSDHSKHVIVQTAPAIRAGLGECFGLPPGTLVTGRMVAALRRLGFASVFDTNFTADLTILEEGNELLMRLKTTGSPWPCPSSPAAALAGSSLRSISTPTSCPTFPPPSRRSRCSAPSPRPTTPRRPAGSPGTSWWCR